jgi:hypothetical protein
VQRWARRHPRRDGDRRPTARTATPPPVAGTPRARSAPGPTSTGHRRSPSTKPRARRGWSGRGQRLESRSPGASRDPHQADGRDRRCDLSSPSACCRQTVHPARRVSNETCH